MESRSVLLFRSEVAPMPSEKVAEFRKKGTPTPKSDPRGVRKAFGDRKKWVVFIYIYLMSLTISGVLGDFLVV